MPQKLQTVWEKIISKPDFQKVLKQDIIHLFVSNYNGSLRRH